MKVRDIELVCTGFVDLCGAVPYANRDMGMGKCIVSSPLLMFIEPQQQEEFATWLATSCYDRFLTFDLNNDDRFLHSGPKKVHIHHVLEVHRMAEIDTVNIYVYGMKSNWQSFAWLDIVQEHNPEADILMDIGFYFNVERGGEHLSRKAKTGGKFRGRAGVYVPHAVHLPENQHGGNVWHLLMFSTGKGGRDAGQKN